MTSLTDIWSRIKNLFRRNRIEDVMEDEIAFHIDMAVQEKVEGGMDPEAARREALCEFGGVEHVKEDCRDAWGTRLINDFLRDLRLGLRQVKNNKRYALVVVLTLGLCIGANTAIFSMLNNVLFKPYPYPEAERLVRVVTDLREQGHVRTIGDSTLPAYLRYREAPSIAESGFYQGKNDIFMFDGVAEHVRGAMVTPSFFRVIDVRPLHGRWFYDEEGEDGRHHVIMLSHAFWQSAYNGDTSIVGRHLEIDGENFEVVGIMPEGFYFIGSSVRYWRPYPISEDERSRHPWSWSHLFVVSRLKPGATLLQAQAELDTIAARMVEDYPEQSPYVDTHGWKPRFVDYHEHRVEDAKTALYLLQGSAWLVLLIGCVNVANLSLTRATARARELALRAMLGAGTGRIARMLLTESFLYCMMGCMLGLLLGFAGIESIKHLDMYRYPREESLGLDRSVLFYTVGISLLCALVVGLAPLLSIIKTNLASSSHNSERTATPGAGARRLRNLLVVAQVSMTFVLLIGSGLMIKSLAELLKVDPGFDPERVMTVRVDASSQFSGKQTKQYYSGLLEHIHQMPGVVAAGTNVTSPFSGDTWTTMYHIEAYDYQAGEANHNFAHSYVDGRYFEALGLQTVMGRVFEPSDLAADSQPTAIVDKNFADRYFPDGDVIGKRLTNDVGSGSSVDDDADWHSIVGVVNNVKHYSLSDSDENPKPRIYLPAMGKNYRTQQLIVRFAATDTAGKAISEETIIEQVKAAVLAYNPNIPPYNFRMLEERIDRTLRGWRASIHILLTFAGLAIILSAIGLYGVIAYTVEQRWKEIGIRLALGAQPRSVMRMILRQGITMTVVGLVIGLLGAAASSSLIESQLYEVASLDPAVYAMVAVLLALVSFLATYFPSRRALRIDPMATLRYE